MNRRQHLHPPLQAPELDEILTRPPASLVRWGITLLFALGLLLVAASWFIRYPDVLKGSIVITTERPPVRVYSRATGRLVKLLVPDTATVQAGQVLAEIENTTHLENVPVVRSLSRQVLQGLRGGAQVVQWPNPTLTFGDLQTEVNNLIRQYTEYRRLRTDAYARQQLAMLDRQIADYRRLVAVNETQATINGQEFANVEHTYNTNRKLYEDKIYSRLDFLKEENTYLAKKKESETYRRTAIENSLTLSEREKQRQTLQHDTQEKQLQLETGIRQSISTIENVLQTWQQNYVLKAPTTGKLAYLKTLNTNDFVRTNDTLFALVTPAQPLVGFVTISTQRLGKLRIGQRVIIRLDDYPYEEFGILRGVVEQLAPSTNRQAYRVRVRMANGLQTAPGRPPLAFRP
ncbi:MAG: HlyD family efflux transporter periplasmic adaptor subunit [Cytophagales bacterium]|nr:MAG: HlyD family efflux transporter periplasmic adaptor subunit [Cytophagales bacterium]